MFVELKIKILGISVKISLSRFKQFLLDPMRKHGESIDRGEAYASQVMKR